MKTLTRAAADTALRPTLPRVNLLPGEIGERRKVRRAQLGAGAAGCGALGLAVLLYVLAAGQVARARDDLGRVQAQHTGLQTKVSSYDGVVATYAQVEARQAMLRTAMGGEVQWSRFLNGLSLTTPDTVWLTQMTVAPAAAGAGTSTTVTSGASTARTGGATAGATGAAGSTAAGQGIATISFQGTALSYKDVATWIESLVKEKAYVNPYVTQSAESLIGTRKVVTFTGSVVVTQDALSQRYTKPAGN